MTATAAGILAELDQRGIELQAEGGRLRFRPADRMTADLRTAVVEHKAELLAALATGGATAPVVEGFDGRDVQIWNQRPAVGPGLRDEQAVLHGNGQAGVTDIKDRAAGNVDAQRLERLTVQKLLDLGGVHTHSIHHDGAALQLPNGDAPAPPTTPSWIPGHALAGERPGWTPEGWRGRLLYLAGRCENDRPERAEELRQAAEAMLTGKPGLPENVERIGDIVARVVPWAKYFRKPA